MKCLASENGICKNIFAFGLGCDGYSNKCTLKPHYDNVRHAVNGYVEVARQVFGIRSDKE